MSVTMLANIAGCAVPICWTIIALLYNWRLILPHHFILLISTAFGGYLLTEILKRQFSKQPPFQKWVSTCFIFFSFLLPFALVFVIPENKQDVDTQEASDVAVDPPKKKVGGAKKKDLKKGVAAADVKNIQFSDDDKKQVFTGISVLEFPKNTLEPLFIGIYPPGQFTVHTSVSPEDITLGETYFLFDRTLVKPPFNDLGKTVQQENSKDKAAALHLQSLPFDKTFGFQIENYKVSQLYLLPNNRKQTQTVTTQIEVGDLVQQWIVTVDREGINVTLPSTDHWEDAWVVPIHDPLHQAKLLGESISENGLTETEFIQLAKRFCLGKKILDPQEISKVVENSLTAFNHGRPYPNLNYQALVLMVDGAEPATLARNVIFHSKNQVDASQTNIHLQLNASTDDALKAKTAWKPAKVLVGLKRRPAPLWRW